MTRMLTRRVAVGALIVSILVLATVAVVAARRSSQAAPPWSGDLNGCRSEPMAHVHHPQRLTLLAPCSTIRGKVVSVRFVPAFDDVKVTIMPDDDLKPYLPHANQGVIVADIIATDQVTVNTPPVGSVISAWGSWVVDKATKTTMLLPAYRVDVNQLTSDTTVVSGQSVEKRGPQVRRELLLAAKTSERVVVGGRIDVRLQAQWLKAGRRTPASQIRLFTEMTTSDGKGVRWKTAMTNTNGMAVLHLVAIQLPASYTFTVYASPSKQPVTAAIPILVTKA